MATENHITTSWKGDMLFETNSLTGQTFFINDSTPDAVHNPVTPKALMLSSLAGCSGLDVVSLANKMKLDLDAFRIETKATLTDEHPRIYDKVTVEYHFEGSNLNEEKLKRCVELSVEKYCGVMEMFRQFAAVDVKTVFHHKS
jgi:putative redox protein